MTSQNLALCRAFLKSSITIEEVIDWCCCFRYHGVFAIVVIVVKVRQGRCPIPKTGCLNPITVDKPEIEECLFCHIRKFVHFSFYQTQVSLGSDLWVLISLSHSKTMLRLNNVTLADEDSNSIPTDDVNRAFLGNVAMQVAPSDGQH